ncbi:hypothetical protein [Sphingomonas adhaesiva]|nr:hypothetical protein [Sphingomonas adhaesiva]
MSQNDAQPSALPLDAGIAAKNGWSSRPAIRPACAARSFLVANGP